MCKDHLVFLFVIIIYKNGAKCRTAAYSYSYYLANRFLNDLNLIFADPSVPGQIIGPFEASVRLSGDYFHYEFNFSVPEGLFQLAKYFRLLFFSQFPPCQMYAY